MSLSEIGGICGFASLLLAAAWKLIDTRRAIRNDAVIHLQMVLDREIAHSKTQDNRILELTREANERDRKLAAAEAQMRALQANMDGLQSIMRDGLQSIMRVITLAHEAEMKELSATRHDIKANLQPVSAKLDILTLLQRKDGEGEAHS